MLSLRDADAGRHLGLTIHAETPAPLIPQLRRLDSQVEQCQMVLQRIVQDGGDDVGREIGCSASTSALGREGHVQSLTNQERPCATHLNGHGSGQRGPVAAPVRPVTSLPDVCVITAIYAEIMGRILRIRKLFTARNAAIKGGIRRKGTSRSAAPRLSLPGSQIAHARFLIHAEAVAPALLGGVKGHVGVMEQMV